MTDSTPKRLFCIWCGFDKETHTDMGWEKHHTDKKILYDSPLFKEHPSQECMDCGIYHTSYTLQINGVKTQ